MIRRSSVLYPAASWPWASVEIVRVPAPAPVADDLFTTAVALTRAYAAELAPVVTCDHCGVAASADLPMTSGDRLVCEATYASPAEYEPWTLCGACYDQAVADEARADDREEAYGARCGAWCGDCGMCS
jgi:hypothetical protein